MTCRDFELLLAERASLPLASRDSRESRGSRTAPALEAGEAALAAHLAGCAACRAESARLEELYALARAPVASDAEERAAQALPGRLVALARQALRPAPRPKAGLGARRLAVPMAAAVALAVVLPARLWRPVPDFDASAEAAAAAAEAEVDADADAADAETLADWSLADDWDETFEEAE